MSKIGIYERIFRFLLPDMWRSNIRHKLQLRNMEKRLHQLECNHPIKWREMVLDGFTSCLTGAEYYHEECTGCKKDFGVFKGKEAKNKRKKEILKLQVKEL